MQIIGDFYKLTSINEHSPKYDLELLHSIGGKNPREEFKAVAYGISLESALERIILYSVNKKLGDETVSFKRFLDEYKEAADKVRRELREAMS